MGLLKMGTSGTVRSNVRRSSESRFQLSRQQVRPPAIVLPEDTGSNSVSLGDGLAIAPSTNPPWVVVVPFALPGEVARVKIHQSLRLHSISSLLEIETPNPTLRDSSRVKCRYFGVCGGCQYQVSSQSPPAHLLRTNPSHSGKQLSYDTQLDLKRNVIVKAYRNFSGMK
jgi:tRNA (uracil-5-)-methyltransferase